MAMMRLHLALGVLAFATSATLVACRNGAETWGEHKSAERSETLVGVTPIDVGPVTTYAGNGTPGSVDSPDARLGSFNDPAGIAVNLTSAWVADWGNNAVRQLLGSGSSPSLSTLAPGRPNLLVNPRGEDASATTGVAGWKVSTGEWRVLSRGSLCNNDVCGHPYDGTYWFSGGPVADAVMYQQVVVADNPDVGAGKARYHVSAMLRGNSADQARVQLHCFTSSGSGCGVLYDSGWLNPQTWTPVGADVLAPTNAHRLRVRLETHALSGTVADAYFDAVQLRALRPTGAPISDTDRELLGPAAVGVLGSGSGNLLVGGEGLWTVAQETGTATKLTGSNGYVMPRRVSSISVVKGTNRAYIADPTDPLLHVRSHSGKSYRVDVLGEPNGEPLAVAANALDSSVDILWVTFRGFQKVYQFKCPLYTGTVDTTAITTCTYENVALGSGSGFADDLEGVGGERFRQGIYGLAIGQFGDLLIAEDYNNAVRRNAGSRTLTIGGGTRGYLDGEPTDAQFWGPTGLAARPGTGDVFVADRNNNAIRRIQCGGGTACDTPFPGCAVFPRDDVNPCTTDSCTLLAVLHVPVADGTLCSDRNACTGADASTEKCGAGMCVPGPPVPTDDGNACTVDSCSPATGVQHTNVANGTSCSDTNACTNPDACASGACVSGPAIPIDDGKVCTADSCDPATGVKHTNLANGTSCNDANACTTGESCSSGNCTGGAAVAIDDNDACTIDTCDPATGPVHTQKTFADPNTTDCSVPICNPATGLAPFGAAPEGMLCGAANSGRRCDHAGVCEATAPPVFTAPAVDPGKVTSFDDLVDGIWKGSSAIQTGVAPNKIEPGHAGWLIGRVKTAAGTDLANVVVSIAGDSTFGSTKTRADGKFDLIVNGGRSYIVRFEKNGHLPVDRQVYVGWEETSSVPAVRMLTADATANAISFGSTAPFQQAVGTKSSDIDGDRTARLMIPSGTVAKIGTVEQPNLTIRLTEYTVGAEGGDRMPAPLPPTSAYTYAVEISADNVNGARVDFTTPVNFYTENFLGAEVGSAVPAGSYDFGQRRWVPEKNGIVIKVISGKVPTTSPEYGTAAQISVRTDGAVANATKLSELNFTAEELKALRSYETGQQLWRVPISHMTPWDLNYGRGFFSCSGCSTPPAPPKDYKRDRCEKTAPGSIIGCESQSLGEVLPVAGTPFTLNYDSSRLDAFTQWRTIRVGVPARPPMPDGDKSWGNVEVTVSIAGASIAQKTFYGTDAGVAEIPWDGYDAYGRPVVGGANATIEERWYGGIEYLQYIDEFGRATELRTQTFKRQLRPYSFTFRTVIPLPGQPPLSGKKSWSLGGWTLSPHHFYDPKAQMLYLGSGKTRSVGVGSYLVKRMMGSGGGVAYADDDASATGAGTGVEDDTGHADYSVVAAPNGTIFFTDPNHHVVRRVDKNGNVKTIAGNKSISATSNCADVGDGKDSVLFGRLGAPSNLALGRDGELYVYDNSVRTIRVLRPSDPANPDKFTIDTVAGSNCSTGTGATVLKDQLAKGTALPLVVGLAAGTDGAVYFAEQTRVWKFVPGTKIDLVAGNGTNASTATIGSIATKVSFSGLSALTVGATGSVYATDTRNVYEILPDGTVQILVTGLQTIVALAATPDGGLLFNDAAATGVRYRIRKIDKARGSTPTDFVLISESTKNGAPADGAIATLNGPNVTYALAAAPDGSVLTFAHNSIYRLYPAQYTAAGACGIADARYLIPDGDSAHCFDASGRHRSTINWRTGASLFTFGYESSSSKLLSITDRDGRATSIVSGTSGIDVKSYFGQLTKIVLSSDGNATSIKDALGLRETTLNPQRSGLLSDLTDGNRNKFFFGFADGRLVSDESPLSTAPQRLDRLVTTDGWQVTHKTPLLRTTIHDVKQLADGRIEKQVTYPDATKQLFVQYVDGRSELTAPDGTKTTVGAAAPDPIWGNAQPRQSEVTVTLPSGTARKTSSIACPPVPGTTTLFSATAQNPTTTLACNAQQPGDPLKSQSGFTNPPLTSETRTWDANGETIVRTSPEGRSSTELRDALGRITSVKVGNLTPTEYTYYASDVAGEGYKGQLQRITNGFTRSTEFKYRGIYETDTQQATPDADAGFVKQVLEANGAKRTFARDGYGHVTTLVEAKDVVGKEGTTLLSWDANGNMKSLQPPGKAVAHGLLYNAINGLKQYTPPALAGITAAETTFGVDADRQRGIESRPDSVQVTPTYDTTSGKLDLLSFSGGNSPTGALDYDYYPSSGASAGKLWKLGGPYGSTLVTFAYDGQMTTKMSWSGDATAYVEWAYNSLLLKSKETTSPGGSSYFIYDNDNLLTCVRQVDPAGSGTCSPGSTSADMRLTRSAEHGKVTKIEVGNVVETIDYSDSAPDNGGATNTDNDDSRFGELRHHKITHGGTVLAEFTYDSTSAPRDTLGRIDVKTESFRDLVAPNTWRSKDFDYGYDERGRLEDVTVDGGSASDEAFGYDLNGNRTSYTGSNVNISTNNTRYDDQDRLDTYGTATFTYGANGEVRTKTEGSTVTTYTYDALGNLTKVQRTGTNPIVVDYIVDGLGRRIGKRVGGVGGTVVKRWLYRDGLNPVAELDGAGAIVSRFVYGSRPNVPDLVIRGGKTYRLIADQLGSPRLAVDITTLGACTAGSACTTIPYRADYSAFGEVEWKGSALVTASDTLDWIPFGFAGGLYDRDTGLVRFGARDYDPSIGRWVSKDPIRFDGGQANLFVYVGNDPVNNTDAQGTGPISFFQCLWDGHSLSECIDDERDNIRNGPLKPLFDPPSSPSNPGQCFEPPDRGKCKQIKSNVCIPECTGGLPGTGKNFQGCVTECLARHGCGNFWGF